jgi:hypothetical protein
MNKSHIGYGGAPYDSKAEAAASFKFVALGCIPSKDMLPHVFTDSEGTEFRAKADFYHPASSLFIEYKCAMLNGCKTKSSAEKQLRERQKYRRCKGQSLLMKDRLDCQWNHARRKQAIVQRLLTPLNFIVVFDKPPTVSEAVTYFAAGIMFIPMSELPRYLTFTRLAKAGIPVSYRAGYDTEAGPLTFGLERRETAVLA